MLALCLVAASLFITSPEALVQPREVKAFEDLPPAGFGYPDTPKWRYLRARQWLYMGMNGELIRPSRFAPPGEDSVIVVQKGNGLELRLAVRFDEVDPIAIVEPTGHVKTTAALQAQLESYSLLAAASLPDFPRIWTPRTQTNDLILPNYGTVLSEKSASQFQRHTPPTEAVAWVVPSILCGHIIFPTQDSAPPENVLWVVPKSLDKSLSKGFALVHSGPLHQGVFLEVAEEGAITLGTGALNVDTYRSEESYWPFRDADTDSFTLDIGGCSLLVLGHGKSMKIRYRDGLPISASGGPPVQ